MLILPTALQRNSFLYGGICLLCVVYLLSACGGSDTKQEKKDAIVADAQTLPNHVQYAFYKRNQKGRKPQTGDLLTFHLVVQNHKNETLRNTYEKYDAPFKELPFEENYFIYKPFFKEVFSLVSEGDSLSFWISADSLANKPGYLKTPKVEAGTRLKYTLKMLRIRSKEEIKRELREKYAEQRKKDSLLIAAYITEIKKNEVRVEVQTTASGLRYLVRKVGKGNPPQRGDTVVVNYVSKFLDGNIYERSEAPTEFVIGDIEPEGLNEGIALMNEGASSIFILPSELGFGEKEGSHEHVPKNAVLVFEVDLLKLKH